MGRIPTGRKDGLKHLNHIHMAILRRLSQGQHRQQIAKDLNVSPKTVTRCANCDLGKRALARLHELRDQETANVMDSVSIIVGARDMGLGR